MVQGVSKVRTVLDKGALYLRNILYPHVNMYLLTFQKFERLYSPHLTFKEFEGVFKVVEGVSKVGIILSKGSPYSRSKFKLYSHVYIPS